MKAKLQKLPDSSGVYFFLGKEGEILYIGKATSLKTRVRSYFALNLAEKRSPLIAQMMGEAKNIKFEKTDSVLEALILEANLIRKHLPPFNSALKDQKSWNYVVVTKEDFPQILVMRESELLFLPPLIKGRSRQSPEGVFGPFTNGYELKDALKIIRKIFPYRDAKCIPFNERPLARRSLGGVGCFNYHISLCPGTCIGAISKKEYAKTIKHIKLFFKGKKTAIIRSLKKEMHEHAKNREFEKATLIKKKIFSLQHIHDIALLKNNRTIDVGRPYFRIEAYDVAHISGTNVVGVMAVLEDGELKKSDYRKFKIKIDQNDDIRALREVLSRRLRHNEWPYPDLIVVDGGEMQMNAARAELEKSGLHIPVVGVIKDEHHRPRQVLGKFLPEQEKEIFLANSEAHRFAIAYHRRLRSKF